MYSSNTIHLRIAALALLIIIVAPAAHARSAGLASKLPGDDDPAAATPPPAAPAKQVAHSFWDRQNAWLFAGITAARFLDYHSTGHMRSEGNEEVLLTNEIVDNKPLFASIEVAGIGASIGLSYLFHRTGHHRLERWVSYIHIGVATFGSIRNYRLDAPNATGY